VAKHTSNTRFAQIPVRERNGAPARGSGWFGELVSALPAQQLDNGQSSMVIDFTRYDLKAHEPQGLQREWSLMNVLNQKGTRTEDKPIRLGQLTPEDQRRIYARYPELKKLA
jgi:hypothetical protein